MASTYAPPTHRAALHAQTWQRASYPLLLLVAAGVFIVTAVALLLPQTSLFSRSLTAPRVAVGGPTISPDDVNSILSYARSMQPDDELIQVRPGVFAKRSNVEGVEVAGTRLYYDIVSHQSFGPLSSGKLAEAQVRVVGREAQNGFLIVVYTRK